MMEMADGEALSETHCSVCNSSPVTLKATINTITGVAAYAFCGLTCAEKWSYEIVPEMVRQGRVVVRP